MNTATETVDLSAIYDPRTNEKQMLFHRASETYKLFGGAMGGGKTGAIVNEGTQLNLDYPENFGLLMRKTWPSFRDTVLPQLERFTDLRLISQWNKSEHLITYINGSKTRYGGLGDKPNDWEKFMSGEYGWIALDQAEQFTFNEFRMLATRLRLRIPGIKYFFLLTCNPNVGWIKDYFIESNRNDRVFIPALPEDNQANLPADYIQRMREVLTPQEIKALLEGDWSAIGAPDDVFEYSKVQAAMKRNLKPGLPISIGIDVARFGDDETTLITAEGLKVRIYDHYQGYDTMKTAGNGRECARALKKSWGDEMTALEFKIDADGNGAGVVDRLNEQRSDMKEELKLESLIITEIHGAAKPKDPRAFKNLRAEIHWGLRELLGDLDLPNDDELRSQFMAIKYSTNSAGQKFIIPKDEIKKKLGRSPDIAEGVIYALADVPKIEFGAGVF